MRELLTEERVTELVAMAKRLVRPDEFGWRPIGAARGSGPPPGVSSAAMHRILRARLISTTGRETFELIATSNDRFSFHLKYRDVILVRLCCSSYHRIPQQLGGGRVTGPHVHYHRPGFGDAYAEGTDRYTHDSVNTALDFMIELVNIQGTPAVQEMLDLR